MTDAATVALAGHFSQFKTPKDVQDGLQDVLPGLIEDYGAAGASLGADWYDEMRDAAAVKGLFAAIPAELPDAGRAGALAGWASTVQDGEDMDLPLVLDKASGGLQRVVANADRHSIVESSLADPRARGWGRAGVGKCDFCRRLIGRGVVYTGQASDFHSHDRCHCVAVMVFDGSEMFNPKLIEDPA